MSEPRTEVWSNGGGKHSAAIAALIIQGKLPKPDIAVIADTGKEKQTTWDYLEAVIRPALRGIGIEMHIARKADFAKEGMFDLQGKTLLVPAFSNETAGHTGKLSSFCSDKWKRRVRERWLRARGIRKTRTWLGFAVDEPRRWMKLMKSEMVRLPLVLDAATTKRGCIDIVRDMGWPAAPGSNCWMCPNQSDDEWLEIRRNRPHEFGAAVELETEMRIKDPFAFFHRSCVPLDQVDWSHSEGTFERACASGECHL